MSNLNPEHGVIICTNNSCKLNGQKWPDIPTLLWSDGIDVDASDWLRTLVVEYGLFTSSAKEYAKIIRPYLRFCRGRKRSWQSVDDEFLIVWREHMRRGLKVSIPRVNTSLETIFAFYRWAEENKRIRFQVGIYSDAELPLGIVSRSFPISANKTFSKNRHGRVFGKWTTPLTLSNPRQGVKSRHTPSEEEIRKIHSVVIEREHGVRDSLVFSWAEEAGPRRAEILRLCKSHLPTNEQLANIIERDEPWLISVKRKRCVLAPLHVQPDLIILTLDYISVERRAVVEHCLESIVGYREPDEIFLSGTTGLVLHPDSLTSIGRKIFKEAGVERANIHRLRARFAARTVQTLVDAIFDEEMVVPESNWTETILEKAAGMMGQTNSRSLQPYLSTALNMRIQTADGTKAEKLASRLRLLERQEMVLLNRLNRYPELKRAVRYIEKGRNIDAASALKVLIDELD